MMEVMPTNSEFNIAVHSLVYLAHRRNHAASSEEVAANVCTHPVRIRKVFGPLRRAGYVAPKEGAGGGYALVVAPENIRLGEIYQVICTGSLKPNWCSGEPGSPCMVSSNINSVMEDLFGRAEAHLIAYLDGITVLDVLRQTRDVQEKKAQQG